MGASAMEPVSPSIGNLELTWRSILELCGDLDDQQWKTPTGCPGWSVQDNVSHLVDYEATALGRARPDHQVPELEHLKNPMGESNEIGVDARRALPGPAVLEELREVSAARSEQLRALTPEDLDREVTGPAGPVTVSGMLTLRVMDTWSHEQDIRRALGRPGHERGPAVDEAVAFWCGFLPYVVGKKAGAPDGTTVVFEVGTCSRAVIAVDGGRASAVDGQEAASPTVSLVMPATTFGAHVGGRSDSPDDVTIDGDRELGRRIVENLGVLP